MITELLAAPPSVQGISGGQIFGVVTSSALAFGTGVCLLSGLKGSDKIKITNKMQAMKWGIVTGSVWVAAGGMYAEIMNGLGDASKGMLNGNKDLGDFGLGGTALALTLLAWAPPWGNRVVIPTALSLAAGVIYGQAGGVWGIVVNIIRMGMGIFS